MSIIHTCKGFDKLAAHKQRMKSSFFWQFPGREMLSVSSLLLSAHNWFVKYYRDLWNWFQLILCHHLLSSNCIGPSITNLGYFSKSDGKYEAMQMTQESHEMLAFEDWLPDKRSTIDIWWIILPFLTKMTELIFSWIVIFRISVYGWIWHFYCCQSDLSWMSIHKISSRFASLFVNIICVWIELSHVLRFSQMAWNLEAIPLT